MTISVGDRLPAISVLRIGANGPEAVDLGAKFSGRKVVIFGFPGAFTGVCMHAHVPSFIRTKAGFEAKGVDEVIGMSVNDPFVMDVFDEKTGSGKGGVTLLADAESTFTTAIGMNFSAPPDGFVNRSERYAMYVEDGVVQVLHKEESLGACDISAGEALLAAI